MAALEQDLESRHQAELLELQSKAAQTSSEAVGVENGEGGGGRGDQEGEGAVIEAMEKLKVDGEGKGEGAKMSRARKRKVGLHSFLKWASSSTV